MHASVFLYNDDDDSVANNGEDDNDQERRHLKPHFGSGETTNGATRGRQRWNYCAIRTCVVCHCDLLKDFTFPKGFSISKSVGK